MADSFAIFCFPLGFGRAMAYEVTEEAAYEAAKRHRASILADPANVLPTRTPINRVVFRPVTADIVVAILNENDSGFLDLIQAMEPIGYVE
ncbi:hypothetical protein AB4Z52_28615 [Rhizobium sp. 2YAF20]|uniref:hypothetical protein n=1 Tax=Rhizobium sp. 2YAF20 TaxID=3233027 RepID=UPI003F9EB2CA